MVDTADLKSSDACVVPVRVRPPAPKTRPLLGDGFLALVVHYKKRRNQGLPLKRASMGEGRKIVIESAKLPAVLSALITTFLT